MFFLLTSTQAQTLIDGIYYYLSETTASVTSGGSGYYIGDIVIPSLVTYNETVYRVTSIGSSAYRDCSGLTSITNHNPEPIAISPDVFNMVNKSACTLNVPNTSVSLYKNAPFGKIFLDWKTMFIA